MIPRFPDALKAPEGTSVEIARAVAEVVPWLSLPVMTYNQPKAMRYWGFSGLKLMGGGLIINEEVVLDFNEGVKRRVEGAKALGFTLGLYRGCMRSYTAGRRWGTLQEGDDENTKDTYEKEVNWSREYWDDDFCWVKDVWDMA